MKTISPPPIIREFYEDHQELVKLFHGMGFKPSFALGIDHSGECVLSMPASRLSTSVGVFPYCVWKGRYRVVATPTAETWGAMYPEFVFGIRYTHQPCKRCFARLDIPRTTGEVSARRDGLVWMEYVPVSFVPDFIQNYLGCDEKSWNDNFETIRDFVLGLEHIGRKEVTHDF